VELDVVHAPGHGRHRNDLVTHRCQLGAHRCCWRRVRSNLLGIWSRVKLPNVINDTQAAARSSNTENKNPGTKAEVYDF
jgi:hypothetical protein